MRLAIQKRSSINKGKSNVQKGAESEGKGGKNIQRKQKFRELNHKRGTIPKGE